MGNPMADHFLSFMVFIFKALFLKTLKFQLHRYFSLRRVNAFSWDIKQIIHNLCSYGYKSCNFKIFCISIFSMVKTLKIKKMEKIIAKKISLWHLKNTYT